MVIFHRKWFDWFFSFKRLPISILSIKVRWVVIVPFQCIVLTEQFICKNSSIQTLRCHFACKYWQKKYMWWNDEQKSITHSSLKYTTYKSRAAFEFFLQFCFRYCTKHTSSKSDYTFVAKLIRPEWVWMFVEIIFKLIKCLTWSWW